ncbi:RNA-directed DNA polymerase, eukaryota, reverse transcriptase zinc-binding domain protein, partial [Tanacetum coccineum]
SLSLMGDFNVTLNVEEHSNGTSNLTNDMSEFKDSINSLEVEDICSTGFYYTWTKSLKNPHYNTLKKLDRIMVNGNFLNKYGNASGVFLLYLVSDHSPAIIKIPKGIVKKKKSFRFANYVPDKDGFLDLVKKGWLKDKEVDSDPFNLEKKRSVVLMGNEYLKAAEDELKLLHQKARIKWLKEGDRNSAFFHSILRARKHKSIIKSICCEDGRRVEGDLVATQFVTRFQNFLETTSPIIPLSKMGDIVKLNLNESEAAEMIRNVSDKEIKESLFDIDSTKAAGLDRYSSRFFKKAWDVIGTDICLAVREFFISGI